MFKKVTEQIAKQTRAELGQANINNAQGFIMNTGRIKGSYVEDSVDVIWKKRFYLSDRSSVDQTGIFYYPVPVLDIELYGDEYPSKEPLYHYFWFSDHSPVNNPTSLQEINSGKTGTFVDNHLLDRSNNSYETVIVGRGIQESVPMSLYGKDVSVSVWVIEDYLDWSGIRRKRTILIYSSPITGLNGWTSMIIPVGNYGTTIYIYCYAHDEKTIYEKNISDDVVLLAKETDKNIGVEIDLQGRQAGIYKAVDTPEWGDVPITTTANPKTGNIVNTLSFNRPTNDLWNYLSIFRRDVEPTAQFERFLDNKCHYNNVVVNTSNPALFPSETYLYFDDQAEKIKGAVIAHRNYVANADFSEYDGSYMPTDWVMGVTCEGTGLRDDVSTAYCYRGDYLYNGSCLKYIGLVTETARSYFVERPATSAGMDTANTLSFNYRLVEGENVASLRLFYHTTRAGDYCEVSSVTYDINDFSSEKFGVNSWYHFSARLNSEGENDRDSLYINPGASVMGIRLYTCYEATSGSDYLLDGFHFGIKNTIFSTCYSQDKTIIQLFDKFEKPWNNLINDYYKFEGDTANAIDEAPKNILSMSGEKVFVDSAKFGEMAKFNGGIRLSEEAHNYITNSDFSDGITSWDTTNCMELESISADSPFINNSFARFSQNGESESMLYQEISDTDMLTTANSCFTLWAKSSSLGRDFKMKFIYRGECKDSAYHTITNEWAKYDLFYRRLDFSESVCTCAVSVSTVGHSWELDIAGVQLDLKDYCTDFVCNDVTIPSEKVQQYIIAQSGLDPDYGAVKFWYTPFLNSDSGLAYNGLFYWGDSDNYRTIYWDKSISAFVFRLYNGVDYEESYVATAGYVANTPIHIVASWDTSDSYLYVNSKRGNGIGNSSTTSGTYYYMGSSAPSPDTSYGFNGVLGALRTDKGTWTRVDVIYDFMSDKEVYSTVIPTSVRVENFVGTKEIQGNDPILKYDDDVDIDVDSDYTYVFNSIDKEGRTSQLSSEESIHTPKNSFRYNLENKVPNSSFEIIDYFSGNPLYWSTSERLAETPENCTLDEESYFDGSYSIKIDDENWIESEYFDLSNTAVPYWVSFYNKRRSASEDAPYVSIDFYTDKFDLISSWTYNTFSEVSSTEGKDGNKWIRYARAFTDDISEEVKIASRFAKLKLSCHGNNFVHYDGVQIEEFSLKDWREGYFVGSNQLGGGAVWPGAIPFNALVGRHLQAGELVVSGHSSDGNRIVIGREHTANPFMELKPNCFRWHAPDQNKDLGWNFTKHIESGEAYFGSDIKFDQEYFTWTGVKTNPHVLIIPNFYTTYSTAEPDKAQTMQITKEITSTGFFCNAFIVVSQDNEIVDLDNFYLNNITSNQHYVQRQYTVNDDWIESTAYITTVLPQQSLDSWATLSWELKGEITATDIVMGQIRINMKGTSEPVRLVDNTWYDLPGLDPSGSAINMTPDGATSYGSKTINDDNFSRTRSIYFSITEENEDETIFGVTYENLNRDEILAVNFKPTRILYSPSEQEVIQSGTSVGTFSWVAIDGGVVG